MKIIIDKGTVFTRWTVLKKDNHKSKITARTYYKCKCFCGNLRTVLASSLKLGTSKSCGCLQKDIVKNLFVTHGELKGRKTTRIYNSWLGMKNRCYNKNEPAYVNYGGRGITVCNKWINNFTAFAKDMGPKPLGTSIDRINNNKGYYPKNCRWATRKQQNRNSRQNVHVVYKGKKMLQVEACKLSGISDATVLRRRKAGWPVKDWFKPVKINSKKSVKPKQPAEIKTVTYNNKQYTYPQLAKLLNLSLSGLKYRIKNFPENKWAKSVVLNTTVNYKGTEQRIVDVAKIIKISPALLRYRIKNWPKKFWFKKKFKRT